MDPLHDFCTLVLIGFALIICKQLIHFFIGIIEVVLTAVRLITCQEHIRVQTPRVSYHSQIIVSSVVHVRQPRRPFHDSDITGDSHFFQRVSDDLPGADICWITLGQIHF